MEEHEYIKSKKWNVEFLCSVKDISKALDLIYSSRPVELVYIRADLLDKSKESNKFFVFVDYD